MKTLPKTIGILVLVSIGILASGAAMAQHHGHGHGARFGFYFGVPFYGPAYYPSYYPPYYAPSYYYQPAPLVYSSPPVYVEQSAAQAAPAQPQAQGDWYYCAASRTYYPYARECPSGWQRVPAQPTSR